jgi:hypothetical protein
LPPMSVVWRLAPDDARIEIVRGHDIDAEKWKVFYRPESSDPHGIVEPDHGWYSVWVDEDEFDRHVRAVIEWEVDRSRTNQGLVLGVPAKLQRVVTSVDFFPPENGDGDWAHWEILCAAPYAHELEARLAEVLAR